MPDQKEVLHSGKGVVARLYWMFLGVVLWFFLLIFIFDKHPGFPSFYDASYWAAVASLIIVRYADIRFLNGETCDGTPATMTHWRRYAIGIGATGAVVWVVARLIVHLVR